VFKPMLADEVNLELLSFPVIVSPKLDGVRATFVEGRLLTRSLKLIPNREVQHRFKCSAPLDGELIVGAPNGKSVFRDTMKVVSAHEASIDELKFHIFDMVDKTLPFSSRLQMAHKALLEGDFMVPVPHLLVSTEMELLTYEEHAVNAGFEGVMIRDPNGGYKYGRSTMREGALLKLKRKLTSEAKVVGFEEQMHNANEAKINALGHSERSSHQANKIPTGILGALQVVDKGTAFNIGTGFTIADREEIWKNRPKYLGKLCTYEHLPSTKDAPRHPVFIGWREKFDVST
jgi:DNA ligase-1